MEYEIGYPIIGYPIYFSVIHIETAALFTRQAKAIEVACSNTPGIQLASDIRGDYQGYVIGAIFSSVAFLEAAINELFADPSDPMFSKISSRSKYGRLRLPRDTVRLMAEMWQHGIPRTARYSILEKYAIALSLARKEPMEKGTSPWQPTELLIRLRNTLMHAEPTTEPQWPPENPGRKSALEGHRLGKALTGCFPLNPLVTGGPYFPDKILGHGCATWAVKTSTAFAAAFAQRLGIELPYKRLGKKLVTE
jgi:hypothetical protein